MKIKIKRFSGTDEETDQGFENYYYPEKQGIRGKLGAAGIMAGGGLLSYAGYRDALGRVRQKTGNLATKEMLDTFKNPKRKVEIPEGVSKELFEKTSEFNQFHNNYDKLVSKVKDPNLKAVMAENKNAASSFMSGKIGAKELGDKLKGQSKILKKFARKKALYPGLAVSSLAAAGYLGYKNLKKDTNRNFSNVDTDTDKEAFIKNVNFHAKKLQMKDPKIFTKAGRIGGLIGGSRLALRYTAGDSWWWNLVFVPLYSLLGLSWGELLGNLLDHLYSKRAKSREKLEKIFDKFSEDEKNKIIPRMREENKAFEKQGYFYKKDKDLVEVLCDSENITPEQRWKWMR